jgi:16S rRNA processing protein RimM
MNRHDFVGMGNISGTYGVRGWVKVFSYTVPREQILRYKHWHVAAAGALEADDIEVPEQGTALEAGRRHGNGIVAKLAGIEDRDAAAALIGSEIFVPRKLLPDTEPGQYYWADLAGLAVHDSRGRRLGIVDHLIETGVHDVLVLDGGANKLIPFVPGQVILDVDLKRGVITADWDAAWWE